MSAKQQEQDSAAGSGANLTTTDTLSLWIQWHENQVKRADRAKREAEIMLPKLRELQAELEEEFGNGVAPVAQSDPPKPTNDKGKVKGKYDLPAWNYVIEVLAEGEPLDVGEIMAALKARGFEYSRTAIDNALTDLKKREFIWDQEPTDGRRSKAVYSLGKQQQGIDDVETLRERSRTG